MSSSSDAAASAFARPVWAWIDHAALRHNAARAIRLASGREVIAVVKADGYGHGAVRVARTLVEAGVPRLAVVSLAEGAALRAAGLDAPILVFGGLESAEEGRAAARLALTPVLQDAAGLACAAAAGSASDPLSVELEVDTGMRRMGVPAGELAALFAAATACGEVAVEGLFSHLARADERDPAASRGQAETFGAALATLEADRLAGLGLHLCNSGGLIQRAAIEGVGLATTAVRPGLLLYGLSPLAEESAAALDLEPVMSLAARVAAVRRIEAGDRVGYGGTWQAERATTIATLPLGYADGVPRSLSGAGHVHLAGAPRPIVGRVSMDSCCVDVGDTDVAPGAVATFFGRTPAGERVPIEDLAAAAGTIGYELLVGVGARVPRIDGEGPPPAQPPAVSRGDAPAD